MWNGGADHNRLEQISRSRARKNGNQNGPFHAAANTLGDAGLLKTMTMPFGRPRCEAADRWLNREDQLDDTVRSLCWSDEGELA